MKKILPFFMSFILLSSFALMMFPNNVSASETEYIPLVDYQDDTNGIFGDTYTNHQIISEGTNKVLKDIKIGNSASNQRADVTTLPNSFEIDFDFKSDSVGSSGSMIIGVTETNGITYVGFRVDMNSFGFITINSANTSYNLNDGVWHNIFLNVTTDGSSNYVVRISVDGSALSAPYNCGASSYDEFVIIGGYETSTNNGFYWDNIYLATRIGNVPNADFNYSPSLGDGLTNFIFVDNSTVDGLPSITDYYWTFGDGNHSYDQNCNHTYINAGTYQIILNVSNQLGYDLAYTNITVSAINIGIGGEEISDDMFGFIALLALITALNLYAMKSGTGLLSIFALMGLIISASLLWPDSPITTALLMVTVLGNIAITIKTVT